MQQQIRLKPKNNGQLPLFLHYKTNKCWANYCSQDKLKGNCFEIRFTKDPKQNGHPKTKIGKSS